MSPERTDETRPYYEPAPEPAPVEEPIPTGQAFLDKYFRPGLISGPD